MPSPTILSYFLRDSSGEPGSCDLFVAYDAAVETISALLGAWAAFGGLLDAVTGCKIQNGLLRIPALPDPSWKAAAVADTDIQQTLLENFNATDTIYPQEFIVPGVRDTLITGDTPIIGSGAIKTMNDAIIGSVGTGVFANNKYLLDLISLRDAGKTFRKRKGTLAKSRVTP